MELGSDPEINEINTKEERSESRYVKARHLSDRRGCLVLRDSQTLELMGADSFRQEH